MRPRDARFGIRLHPHKRALRCLVQDCVRCFPNREEGVVEYSALFSDFSCHDAQPLFEIVRIDGDVAPLPVLLVERRFKRYYHRFPQRADLSRCGAIPENSSLPEPGKQLFIEEVIKEVGLFRQ
jgi:hypothetical protein